MWKRRGKGPIVNSLRLTADIAHARGVSNIILKTQKARVKVTYLSVVAMLNVQLQVLH